MPPTAASADTNAKDDPPSSSEPPQSPTKSEQTPPATWSSLFFFTTRAHTPLLVCGTVASACAGACVPATAFVTGKLFDGFTTYASGGFEPDAFMTHQKKYIVYLVAISLATWFFKACEFVFWLAFGELQAKSARDRLFHGLLGREIEWYDMRKNGIGALLPRLQAQIKDLQLSTSQPLGILVNAVMQAILSLTEAFYYSWKLTLVTLSPFPITVVIMLFLSGWMQKNIAKQQEKLSEALKFSTNAFSAIETVKCFNGQEIEKEKFMVKIREASRFYFKEMNAGGLQMASAVLLSLMMFVVGFYYGGVLINLGDASAGTVVTTFFAAVGGFQAIQMLLPQIVNLEKGRTAGATLRSIMAEVQKGGVVQNARGLKWPDTCRGEIEVKNVTFAYPARRDQLALDNVSLSIPNGEMTFLIGKSGSGKSTLSQLLMRFYFAETGTIKVDGCTLEELDVGWLRSNITFVEQTSLLFNDTVFRNIAFGRKDHENVTKEEVMGAAEFALLQLMISDMPDGLDTSVGFKGGAMSGGQRQRMALARARLRDTPILILDESTSALDHISRQLMMDAIRLWRQGRTTIIITHDISQILDDDYVYLLEHGKLVQEGYRKHIEKMADTPFQGFLPPELRATASSVYQEERRDTNFESIRTRESSIDTLGDMPRRTYVQHDPLEDQLEASENRPVSFLPGVFEGSPIPAYGRFGRPGLGGTPWMRALASPTQPSPTNMADRRTRLWDWTPSPVTKSPVGSPTWSLLLEKLVDQTGKLAAETRLDSKGAERKPVRTAEGEGGDAEAALAILSGENNVDSVDSVAGVESLNLQQICLTIWPNIDWSARILLVLGFFGATVHAVATPLTSYMLAKLMQTYAHPKTSQHQQLIYSLAMLGIAVADGFHCWLFRFVIGCVAQLWVDGFRDQAVARILDQPKAFFDKEENGVSRMTDVLDRNAEFMREILGNFASLAYCAVVMVFVSLVWATVVQWKMSLIALSLAPYILGVTRIFAAVSGKWESKSNDAAEDASAIFSETFTNIKTVRALTLEHHFRDKYKAATDKALMVGFLRSFNTGFFFGLSDSAGSFSSSLVMYVGSKFVQQGTSPNDVVMVATMLMFTISNLSAILECIPQVNASQDSAVRVLRLARLPKDSHEHLGNTRMGTIGEIVFDNLRFAYPTRPEQTILKNINLRIEPGTSTAIVGGSGSGKSTIANLLLNIWSTAQMVPIDHEMKRGELTIAGRDINTIMTPALRSLVVPVQQAPTLFAATVSENITYGLPFDSPHRSPDSIKAAAQQAGIHDFINSLPLGYSTIIGYGGMGLSGGQAQRVAIARALVRKPSVLVLDEATSALDVESAGLVRNTIQTLVRSSNRTMTVIIITHGRDMMEIAENIVVLDHGNIVEVGGFEELLKKGGALSNLLSGGEWTGDKGKQKKRGVPKLKEIDWKARQTLKQRRARRYMT
jgi:ATP-binding cassette, subfamily B (MDR/TAP), member 1